MPRERRIHEVANDDEAMADPGGSQRWDLVLDLVPDCQHSWLAAPLPSAPPLPSAGRGIPVKTVEKKSRALAAGGDRWRDAVLRCEAKAVAHCRVPIGPTDGAARCRAAAQVVPLPKPPPLNDRLASLIQCAVCFFFRRRYQGALNEWLTRSSINADCDDDMFQQLVADKISCV